MKKYIKPTLNLVQINVKDIIQASGYITDGGVQGDYTGGGANAGWGTTTGSIYDDE